MNVSKCFVLLLLGLILAGGATVGCKNNDKNGDQHTSHTTQTDIERGRAPQ